MTTIVITALFIVVVLRCYLVPGLVFMREVRKFIADTQIREWNYLASTGGLCSGVYTVTRDWVQLELYRCQVGDQWSHRVTLTTVVMKERSMHVQSGLSFNKWPLGLVRLVDDTIDAIDRKRRKSVSE